MKPTIARTGLLLVVCAALAGCVSLLPKSKPAQLYSFGAVEPAATAQPAAAGGKVILLGRVDFAAAAATDRILTVAGQDAAYIEASRWVSPAPVLFEEALAQSFQRTQGAPRLVRGGSVLRAPQMLSLQVQSFEARYDQGQDAAPVVVVRLHAMMSSVNDRQVQAEETFTSTARASDNRVGAIVQAYDVAVQEALGKLIAWTEAT